MRSRRLSELGLVYALFFWISRLLIGLMRCSHRWCFFVVRSLGRVCFWVVGTVVGLLDFVDSGIEVCLFRSPPLHKTRFVVFSRYSADLYLL